MPTSFDPQLFQDIQQMGNELKAANAAKVVNFQNALDAYLMNWNEQPGGESIKVTISPTARNAVAGATRLLSATAPNISVSQDADVLSSVGNEQLETALKHMWDESGAINGAKVHLDAALSAVLYGEVHLALEQTKDLAQRMSGAKGKAAKRFSDRLFKRTPIRFRCLSPLSSYARMGAGGLSTYFREEFISRGELRTTFPDIPAGNDARVETLNEWWDLDNHYVWITGEDPLLAVQHGLPFIPVSVTYSDGSTIFSKPEERVQPFLFTFLQSGLHQRESLMLTVMFTKLFQFGLTPPLIVENAPSGEVFQFNADDDLPVGYVPAGGKIQFPMTNVIDPNVFKALDIARGLGEQSTIYQQALGAPLDSAQNTFSTLALLSQAGRLPLVGPQEAIAKAIQEVMEMAIEWLQTEGGDHPLLKGINLQQDYKVKVDLDVKLPQDSIRNAQIGAQITSGPNALVSKKYWLENAMGIRNTDQIRQEIAIENAWAVAFQSSLQQALQQEMAAQQQQPGQQPGQQQPGQPGQPPQQGQPGPQQPPQGMPPQGMPAPDGSLQQPLEPRAAGANNMQSAAGGQ